MTIEEIVERVNANNTPINNQKSNLRSKRSHANEFYGYSRTSFIIQI